MTKSEFASKWYKFPDKMDIRYGVVISDADYGYLKPHRWWWPIFRARSPMLVRGQVLIVDWNDGYPMTIGLQGKPGKVGAEMEYYTNLYDALDRSCEIA